MSTTTDTEEAYGSDAPLLALFGTPARTKLLSVFIAEAGRDLTVSQIARQAGMSRASVYNHLDALLEIGVNQQSRHMNAGHSPLYQLNESNEIAELCHQLGGVTLKRLLELDGHTID